MRWLCRLCLIMSCALLQSLPMASLRSEPSPCNADNQVLEVLHGLGFTVQDVRIVGGTHCDPENPTDWLCTTTCGGGSAASQALYQELMYLFLRDTFGLLPMPGEAPSNPAALDDVAAQGKVVVSMINSVTAP